MVNNIREAKKHLMLHTNYGKKIISKKTNIAGVRKLYLEENNITNVYALKDLIRKGSVKFDSKLEDACMVAVGKIK